MRIQGLVFQAFFCLKKSRRKSARKQAGCTRIIFFCRALHLSAKKAHALFCPGICAEFIPRGRGSARCFPLFRLRRKTFQGSILSARRFRREMQGFRKICLKKHSCWTFPLISNLFQKKALEKYGSFFRKRELSALKTIFSAEFQKRIFWN